MKRWLTILLFAAGGFATELVHPLQCSLLTESRLRTGTATGDGERRRATGIVHVVAQQPAAACAARRPSRLLPIRSNATYNACIRRDLCQGGS
ncbi:hypothetical protein WI40_01725 [Burkholderia ubonensis]|uniref:hypothetical protein n=1 Tax=Burkholderia ubonensis TaxID=101571 RepID=UPI00075D59F9|nr:hypothetical protein [Burkholderia ubonensis]KUZ98610.1 hypothetical protein WI40_01725 [Burkholderia ubonensis]